MNSDPHETAAWRAFGMLDADEASAFDEAARLDPELRRVFEEMNGLMTAVAVVSAARVAPRKGEIDRLRARLGFSSHRRNPLITWSGWAAAAALALMWMIQKPPSATNPAVVDQAGKPQIARPVAATEVELLKGDPSVLPAELAAAAKGNEAVAPVRIETKRLIQEIEVLRGKLANFQQRDRERFSVVPGVAWPIVMTMRPPGVALGEGMTIGSLNSMLGDALAGRESLFSSKLAAPDANSTEDTSLSTENLPGVPESNVPVPTAIPIYDTSRDAGTLVVGNLPQLGTNEAYNLWVRTSDDLTPIYVGRLPEAVDAGADSHDFSLGSIGIVPTGFILTRDAVGGMTKPGIGNTILQGP